MRRTTVALILLAASGLVAGGCAGGVAAPSRSMPSSPTRSTPVATATMGAPSVEPTSGLSTTKTANGRIVFEDAGRDFVHTQIWIEDADGSNVRKLVTDEDTDGAAAISPDGRRVVFYRGYPASLEQVLADPTLFGRIMVVNADGSGLHEIETGNRVNRCDASPEGDAWSPDGTRLAFTRVCFDGAGNSLGNGIWTIDVDGTDARQVTQTGPAKSLGGEAWAPHLEDHRAAWSPDGKRLVFARIDTSVSPELSALFTVRSDGKDLHQVTPWKLDANDPDWSPDGSLIAFNSPAESGGDQAIYTIHPDGTGVTRLTTGLRTYPDGGQGTFHPSWSPDGSQILFTHNPATDGWGDLFVMDRDGSDLHVVAETTLAENHAQWGPMPSP